MVPTRPGHTGRVQWHWGNIGWAAAGLAVVASVLFGIAYGLITGQGPAWIREARARARAQAEQARAAAALSELPSTPTRSAKRTGLSVRAS